MVSKSSSRHLSGMFHAHWSLFVRFSLSPHAVGSIGTASLAIVIGDGKMEDRKQIEATSVRLQKSSQARSITDQGNAVHRARFDQA
jgi:hypothetical protein